MTVKKKHIGNVRELKVYRKALLFRKKIYAIANQLPEYEQYNLAVMLRKCSCSIISNLAEGNTNFYYNKEYNHLNMALSKIAETRSGLDIAKMAGYIDVTVYQNTDSHGEEILKMIIGMMNRIQRLLNDGQPIQTDKIETNKIEVTSSDVSDVYNKATTFNDLISDITRKFPVTEKSNMKDQIVRASESILNNLLNSKTSSSPQAFLDLNTSLGSTSECLSFLDMGVMEGFISRKEYELLDDIAEDLLESLTNLMSQQLNISNTKVMTS